MIRHGVDVTALLDWLRNEPAEAATVLSATLHQVYVAGVQYAYADAVATIERTRITSPPAAIVRGISRRVRRRAKECR